MNCDECNYNMCEDCLVWHGEEEEKNGEDEETKKEIYQ